MANDRFRKSPFGGVPVVKAAIERKSGRIHRDHHDELEDDDDFLDEDFSETRDPDDLPTLREGRPIKIRLRHIEKNQDEIRAEVTTIKTGLGKVETSVGNISGKLEIVPQLVETMQSAISALQSREHVTVTALAARVDVETAKKEAEIEVDRVQKLDKVKGNEAKRDWVSKAVAAGCALVAVVSTAIAAGRC
jgi:hypothetical protein